MAGIMKAKKIVLLASGPAKRDAIEKPCLAKLTRMSLQVFAAASGRYDNL